MATFAAACVRRSSGRTISRLSRYASAPRTASSSVTIPSVMLRSRATCWNASVAGISDTTTQFSAGTSRTLPTTRSPVKLPNWIARPSRVSSQFAFSREKPWRINSRELPRELTMSRPVRVMR